MVENPPDSDKENEQDRLKDFAKEIFGDIKKEIQKDQRARAENIKGTAKSALTRILTKEERTHKINLGLFNIILGVIIGILGFYFTRNVIIIVNFIPFYGPIFMIGIGAVLVIYGIWSCITAFTHYFS